MHFPLVSHKQWLEFDVNLKLKMIDLAFNAWMQLICTALCKELHLSITLVYGLQVQK